MSTNTQGRRANAKQTVVAKPVASDAVPVATAEAVLASPEEHLNRLVGRLANRVADIEDKLNLLLYRVTLAEKRVHVLECASKPVWPAPVPSPYCPGPYVEPWKKPYWLPEVWCCGDHEQGKLSDCFT